MVSLLRKRPAFGRLWLAGAISLVGDWLSFVAVSLLAARGETHGRGIALGLALVLAAHSLPGALLAPIAGTLADRFDRRKVLLGAALAQAATTLMMAACAEARWLLGVQLLLWLRAAIAAVVPPAETAAMVDLVEQEELVPANALVSATWSMTFVVGMALGGALATLGPTLAIALDAASFVVAAGLLATLPRLIPAGAATEVGADRGAMKLARAMSGMRAAFAAARARPALLQALFAKGTLALAGGAAWLGLNLSVATHPSFGSAALSLGVVQSVRGAGTGIGPWLAHLAVRGGVPRERIAALADLIALVGMTAFALSVNPVFVLVAALGWGTGSGANWVLSSSALQAGAPREYVGRLASIDELSNTVALVASALVAGVAIDRGVGRAAVVFGAVSLAGAVRASFAWRRARGTSEGEADFHRGPYRRPAAPSSAGEA
jgi:MFS family permease